MVEPLSVNTDGVRALGDIHSGVASGLASLTAGAPGSAQVATSHGTIAYGVGTALTAALSSRSGSMNATQTSGAQLSELLHQAAMAYERGDQRGAEAIKAAADAIARGGPQAAGGTSVGEAAGPGSGGGTDAIGQIAGQLGQLGQQGQQLGAPLQALAQPLQQLPQQVVKGVQQIAQSTTQSTGFDQIPVREAANQREDISADNHPPQPPVEQHAGAAPDTQPGAGAAPVGPAGRQEPTPTRPTTH
ncbi:MAG: ESX-1 secretion-associated protein [Mycobacterium sp.]